MGIITAATGKIKSFKKIGYYTNLTDLELVPIIVDELCKIDNLQDALIPFELKRYYIKYNRECFKEFIKLVAFKSSIDPELLKERSRKALEKSIQSKAEIDEIINSI